MAQLRLQRERLNHAPAASARHFVARIERQRPGRTPTMRSTSLRKYARDFAFFLCSTVSAIDGNDTQKSVLPGVATTAPVVTARKRRQAAALQMAPRARPIQWPSLWHISGVAPL